ncbi:MAG: hypothetical protein IJL36_10080 [Clostridia bacterium]|nr:hypothetical protein [Clostridia bacterium]
MKKHFIIVLCLMIILSSFTIISANAKVKCSHPSLRDTIASGEGNCQTYVWRRGHCAVCGEIVKKTYGYGSHKWAYNGCGKPQKCTVSGCHAQGSVINHSYTAATCTGPAYCVRCTQSTGSINPDNHNVNTATGKCYRCNKQLFTPKK